MSLDFLGVERASERTSSGPLARSPMERMARAAGARFETRDGWSVAVDYGAPAREAERARETVAWADVSHLGKLEVQADLHELATLAGAPLELGSARRIDGAWWCPLTPRRLLIVGETRSVRDRLPAGTAVDLTTAFAALVLAGPQARETFARFCALDLRPAATPLSAVRPGSIARQPGIVLRAAEDRFLLLFGAATGQYMWTVVQDAATHLGGGPMGTAALEALKAGHPEEVSSRA